MTAVARAGRLALFMLCAAGLFAAPAEAVFLGLNVGDVIKNIEFDALLDADGGPGGDGVAYTFNNPGGTAVADGRLTAIVLTDNTVLPDIGPTGVNSEMRFEVDLVTEVNSNFGPFLIINIILTGGAGATPDFQGGLNIGVGGENIFLEGNFVGNVVIQGTVNLLDVAGTGTLTTTGQITVTGGNASLVAALGGNGSNANLIMQASLFGAVPPLNTLLADFEAMNSNFAFSLSGTISPLNPAAFPEPSVAALMGTGLLGLLALVRRYRS